MFTYLSVNGGLSTGGLVLDFCTFSVSISENSRLGATEDTGTQPDSAPQVPLKTP